MKKIFCLIYLISIPLFYVYGQGYVPHLDSLKKVAEKNTLPPDEQFLLLRRIATLSSEPDQIIIFAKKALSLHEKHNLPISKGSTLVEVGIGLSYKGRYEEAAQILSEAVKVCQQQKDSIGLAIAYNTIGDLSVTQKKYDNAVYYTSNGLTILKAIHDSTHLLPSTALNLGYSYYSVNELDSAIIYLKEAQNLAEQFKFSRIAAYAIGNLGLCYAAKGEDALADLYLLTAIKILNEKQDWLPITEFKSEIANNYLKHNLPQKALQHAKHADSLATEIGILQMLPITKEVLAKAYAATGNYALAYKTQLAYSQLNDSILNDATIEKINNLQADYELELKEAELNLLQESKKSQRLLVIAMAIVIVLLMVLALILFYHKRRKQQMLELLQLKNQQLQRQNEQIKQFTLQATDNL